MLDSLGSAFGMGGLGNIFIWAMGIGAVLASGVIIYGGVLRIVSAGNSSSQEEATKWIKAAIYGLLLLLGAYLLLRTINPAILGLSS